MRLEVRRQSDLAVRALRALAADSQRVKSADLATRIGTTAGFVPQVLSPLIQSGWVRSDPGPTGGYSLAVDLAEVSLLAVIEATEGPTDSGRCVLADRPCNEFDGCALHVPWHQARAELLRHLAAVSVDDPTISDSMNSPS